MWKLVWTVLKEMKEQMSSPAAVSLDKRNKKVSEKLPRVSHHSSGPERVGAEKLPTSSSPF